MVPKSIFPDTYLCTDSENLLDLLRHRARHQSDAVSTYVNPAPEDSSEAIDESSDGAEDSSRTRGAKGDLIEELYRFLATTLGLPPLSNETFKWEYNDKDGNARMWQGTPQEFYADFCKRRAPRSSQKSDEAKEDVPEVKAVCDPTDTIDLIFDSRKAPGAVYTIAREENVWETKPTRCKSWH